MNYGESRQMQNSVGQENKQVSSIVSIVFKKGHRVPQSVTLQNWQLGLKSAQKGSHTSLVVLGSEQGWLWQGGCEMLCLFREDLGLPHWTYPMLYNLSDFPELHSKEKWHTF